MAGHALCWIAAVGGRRVENIALHANTTHRADGFKVAHFFVGSAELSSPKSSSSQSGQDLLIAEIFANKTSGFFVDLASNDATTISNTFVLERDLGWDGICIEANPVYLWRLAQRRCTLVAGVVTGETDAEVHFATSPGNPAFAGVIGDENHRIRNKHRADTQLEMRSAVSHRTATLELVLDRLRAPATMDYLSLDIEGSEFSVLRSFPFKRYTFTLFTIERPDSELRSLLHESGYLFCWCLTTYGDVLYAHRSTLGTPLEARLREAIATWRVRQRNKKCLLNYLHRERPDPSRGTSRLGGHSRDGSFTEGYDDIYFPGIPSPKGLYKHAFEPRFNDV